MKVLKFLIPLCNKCFKCLKFDIPVFTTFMLCCTIPNFVKSTVAKELIFAKNFGSKIALFPQCICTFSAEWKNETTCSYLKIFRESSKLEILVLIYIGVLSSILNALISRNFSQKLMRLNLCNFHTHTHSCIVLISHLVHRVRNLKKLLLTTSDKSFSLIVYVSKRYSKLILRNTYQVRVIHFSL